MFGETLRTGQHPRQLGVDSKYPHYLSSDTWNVSGLIHRSVKMTNGTHFFQRIFKFDLIRVVWGREGWEFLFLFYKEIARLVHIVTVISLSPLIGISLYWKLCLERGIWTLSLPRWSSLGAMLDEFLFISITTLIDSKNGHKLSLFFHLYPLVVPFHTDFSLETSFGQ